MLIVNSITNICDENDAVRLNLEIHVELSRSDPRNIYRSGSTKMKHLQISIVRDEYCSKLPLAANVLIFVES